MEKSINLIWNSDHFRLSVILANLTGFPKKFCYILGVNESIGMHTKKNQFELVIQSNRNFQANLSWQTIQVGIKGKIDLVAQSI